MNGSSFSVGAGAWVRPPHRSRRAGSLGGDNRGPHHDRGAGRVVLVFEE
jgi:hypothetical protein